MGTIIAIVVIWLLITVLFVSMCVVAKRADRGMGIED
jgi:hypothetical protein